MKIKLLIIALSFSVISWGQTIFQFDFESGNTPSIDNAIVTTVFSTIGTLTANTGVTCNGVTAMSHTAWNTNDGYRFTVNTTGFDNLVFSYIERTSNVAISNFLVRASLDGISWTTIRAPYVPPTSCNSSGNLSLPVAFSNVPNVFIEILKTNNAGNTGNVFRIDDVTLLGTIFGPSPEINVTGNGNNILTGDITPVTTDFTDFGNVNIASSFSRSFVVQNLGSANLNVTAATISGTNASEFVITTSPVGTITALGNTGLAIQFTPTASGIRTATVTITNNDSNEGSYTFAIQGNGVCVPAVIASVFPTSGPAGTEVTINASSGSLLGSTVNFNGTAATIVSSSALQLVVLVPAAATTGTINIVNTTTSCVTSTSTFTVIKTDVTSCQGSFPTTTDLIIYEVHDENAGSGGTISFYNGTAATINLTNYRLYRTTTYGNGADANYATLTGTIASGSLGFVQVTGGTNTCTTPASTNGTVSGGFNNDDGISLRNAAGTVIIDDVHTYSTGPGYYMVRNVGAYANRTSFVAADWSTTAQGAGVCDPRLGTGPANAPTSPNISAQPSIALTCASTSAVLSVSATEGFVGGNALAYQWFVVAPSTTTWTALTNAGVYTGTTTATLNISSLTGLDGYQYYCQVRENNATCYIATVAVKISTGATVWNGTVWSNGVPTLSKTATINGNYTTGSNGSFSACNLTINTTFTLIVSANTYVEVENNITNNGTFTILNNGSLVQINDAGVNNGDITYNRSYNVRLQDYVYWSSPVNNFNMSGISSPLRYSWNSTATNANGGQGTWQTASGVMGAGIGYIFRAPTGTSASVVTPLSAIFTGIPSNGIKNVTINRGTDFTTLGTQLIPRTVTDDNWNLVGNPYPSALDIVSTDGFIDANPQIEGFVKIWTHGQLPTSVTDPFYQDFVSNYFVSDYLTYNRTGLTSGPGDYKVGTGQGFMVLMNAGASGSGTITFNNAMRSTVFANNQFYKTNNQKERSTLGTNEQNRIWLDLISSTETTRVLVGYVTGATQTKDRVFDAFTDYKSAQNFYSLLDNEPMLIQGRALPFDVNDRVPMGIKIPTNGTYTIAIAAVDGLFTGNAQIIYLEDKLLNVIHDLTASQYQFTANQGIINDRFVLRYTNTALSTQDFGDVANNVAIYETNNSIKIDSKIAIVKSYVVYNVLGQTVTSANNVNTNVSEITSILKNNQALIVKVTLENGQTIIKKLVF